MSARVYSIADARRKRAARLTKPNSDICACGCGTPLDRDKRCAYDRARGLCYHLEHWLKMEGLTT